jgi:hypothetical protein
MPLPLRIKVDRNTAKIPKMRSLLGLSRFSAGALERFFGAISDATQAVVVHTAVPLASLHLIFDFEKSRSHQRSGLR